MPSHKRKSKLGSMVLGAVKVCKLEGKKKKLVCRTVKAHDRLGSMVLGSTVLNGGKFAVAEDGTPYGAGASAAAARRNAVEFLDGADPRSLSIENASSAAVAYLRKHGWVSSALKYDRDAKMWRVKRRSR